MGTTLKEMKVKRIIDTLFKVKVEAIVDTLADTLIVVVHRTVTKHLSNWGPRHKTRLSLTAEQMWFTRH